MNHPTYSETPQSAPYARAALAYLFTAGWKDAHVYGFQPDIKNPDYAAVWLISDAGVRRRARGKAALSGHVCGLIVSRTHGVTDEFDPEIDGEPGQLKQR